LAEQASPIALPTHIFSICGGGPPLPPPGGPLFELSCATTLIAPSDPIAKPTSPIKTVRPCLPENFFMA
jgi:hypothetical protein